MVTLVVWRCRKCRRILGEFTPGSNARIKCQCNEWNIIYIPPSASPGTCNPSPDNAILVTGD